MPTVIDLLQGVFGASITTAHDRNAFKEFDVKKAEYITEAYDKITKEYGDFSVTKTSRKRPHIYLCRSVSQTAAQICGSAIYPDERPSWEMSDSEVLSFRPQRLKRILLLSHGVIISDQLRILSSMMRMAVNDEKYQKIAKERFEAYVEFLRNIHMLIERGHISIASDKRRWEVGRYNDAGYLYKDEEIRKFFAEIRGVDWNDEKIVKYDHLRTYYGAGAFYDNDSDVKIHSKLNEFYHSRASSAMTENIETSEVRDYIDFRIEDIKWEDVVNIRVNDDAFEKWRDVYAEALTEQNSGDFKKRLLEGLAGLRNEKPDFLERVPGALFCIGAVGLSHALGVGPVVDAMIAICGYVSGEAATKSTRQLKELALRSAQGHYMAMLTDKSA